MRSILMAGALVAALQLFAGTEAQAQGREYPWCARYGPTTYNCGFVSFQQCLATIRGIGGRCEQNPRYVYQEPRRAPRKSRR